MILPSVVVRYSFRVFLHQYRANLSTIRSKSCFTDHKSNTAIGHIQITVRPWSNFHHYKSITSTYQSYYIQVFKFSTTNVQKENKESYMDKNKDQKGNDGLTNEKTKLKLQNLERDLRNQSNETELKLENLEADLKDALGKNENGENVFTDVYFFEYINPMRLFQTFNKLNVGASIICLSNSVFVMPENFNYFLAYAALTSTVFCASWWLLRRVCAVISVSKTTNGEIDTVRISYMSVSGKRQEMYYKLEDFVPISELKSAESDFFIVMEIYGSNDKWYLLSKCGVKDPIALDVILGLRLK